MTSRWLLNSRIIHSNLGTREIGYDSISNNIIMMMIMMKLIIIINVIAIIIIFSVLLMKVGISSNRYKFRRKKKQLVFLFPCIQENFHRPFPLIFPTLPAFVLRQSFPHFPDQIQEKHSFVLTFFLSKTIIQVRIKTGKIMQTWNTSQYVMWLILGF